MVFFKLYSYVVQSLFFANDFLCLPLLGDDSEMLSFICNLHFLFNRILMTRKVKLLVMFFFQGMHPMLKSLNLPHVVLSSKNCI